MVTTDYLRELVAFNYWARDRMLADAARLTDEQYARDLGNSFSSVRDTLNHVHLAEWVWLERWRGVSPAMPPKDAQFATLAELRDAWGGIEDRMRALVDALRGDAHLATVSYRNLAGVAATSPVWQIVVHVVNHGTYHRGQVTTMLRQLGVPHVQGTDLIAFFRERGR